MKRTVVIIAAIAGLAISGCNSKKEITGGNPSTPVEDPQSTPAAVANTIFDAAQTGDYTALPALIASDADGDSKRIAAVASDAKTQVEFKKYFEKATLNGAPVIDGDKASVKIFFGPDGNKEETFEMVKVDGKWFLRSF